MDVIENSQIEDSQNAARPEPGFGPGITRREFVAAVAAAGVAASTLSPAFTSAAEVSGGTTAPSAVITINGKPYAPPDDPRVTLLDLLRDRIGLTGTKKGCDHGQCGACTVLVEGRRVNACLTLAVTLTGLNVKTIEGLADGDALHPVQAAFIKHDAFQCGYCTPGQICSAVGMLAEGHAQTDDDIREQMSGNLCRCGAYPNIVDAIREVQAAKA